MKAALQIAFLVGFALSMAGCKEDRAQRVAESYSTAAKRTERPFPASAEPRKLAIGIDAIPAEEDYEAEAAVSITEANLKLKLSELEEELRR